MRDILVTGGKGALASAVFNSFCEKGLMTKQISLRSDGWKTMDFSSHYAIVHIAGITPEKASSPHEYFELNYILTKELAEKCRRNGIHHFIYLSSMSVYGKEQSMESKIGTIQADTVPNPVTDYGKSKLLAEDSLRELADDSFHVTIIRAPSIYGKGMSTYTNQYRYLAGKLPVIPVCYTKLYKSAICIDNLCELIYMIVKTGQEGIVCPDDGQNSTVDFCSAIYPEKRKSRVLGKIMELMLTGNPRIRDYYGAICFTPILTNIFDGKYRIKSMKDAVKEIYENERLRE